MNGVNASTIELRFSRNYLTRTGNIQPKFREQPQRRYLNDRKPKPNTRLRSYGANFGLISRTTQRIQSAPRENARERHREIGRCNKRCGATCVKETR